MDKLFLDLIVLTHTLFVAFVIFTPFFGNNFLLLYHAILVPFMMMHWVLNDNTCALTLLEKTIRKQLYGYVDDSQCFMTKIINPVYDFKNNYATFSNLIYCVTIGLWLITIYKLTTKYRSGEITSIQDLMK